MPAVENAHTCTTQIKQGEFWTAKQRYGHSIHEISYRACYKPQLPAYFIKRYAEPGQLIYDPFMGRGTTLIEAKLLRPMWLAVVRHQHCCALMKTLATNVSKQPHQLC